jgi:SAM-dependent methyltransferase
VFLPEEGAARIRALEQAVADLVSGGSLDGLRAIDLGAGSGQLSAALASRGASVIAVEGREENARAIRELGIDVRVDDVRSLPWDQLGRFDIVVCSGLLYHLELADQIALAKAMRRACNRIAFIDTEVAWGPVERRGDLSGHSFREHPPGSTPEQKEASALASLDNDESFWLTRASLHALLHDAGFSSSWELGGPGQPRRERRATVVAIAGERVDGAASARPAEPDPGRIARARIRLARLRGRAHR